MGKRDSTNLINVRPSELGGARGGKKARRGWEGGGHFILNRNLHIKYFDRKEGGTGQKKKNETRWGKE